jgi:glucosamine--fructose-6-phosphate aminotransferase (isomerizing)
MCGIVGYIGERTATDVILSGLKRLEYRGYDSAGVSTISSGKMHITKCKGKVSNLETQLQETPHDGNVGIGHTRWATHGPPNDTNAHPHSDSSGKISLIHNGIIENYASLKTYLENEGVEFKSDTDSEVLVQLIGHIYYNDGLSFFEAVRVALQQVVGAYGIVVLCDDEPDTVFTARLGSPLVLGVGEGEYFIASDSSPIIEYTRNIIFMDEGEIARITKDSHEFRKITENEIVSKDIEKIEYSLEQIEKGGYEHFMLKEIFEQSTSVKESMRGRVDNESGRVKLGGLSGWTQQILDADHIMITACGTSWHASLIGSFLLEELLNVPVKVEYASELRYRRTAIDSKTVVIAISQSGETADTLAAVRKAKDLGALTVGVVNVVGSSIARETDCGVYIHAGPEIGVASTKAFTSQVTVLTLISILLTQKSGLHAPKVQQIIDHLAELPACIDTMLSHNDHIQQIAKEFVDAENFLYLGRGYQFPVALEGALKLKEISYIHAEGYPAAEMKHGPIALIDEKMPVVFIVTEKGFDKIVSNIQEVKARGGRIIIVTTMDDPSLEALSQHIIKIPETHNCLTPIVTTIPLQLLAYYISVMKGCDVDQPRNLAKSVTVE